MCGRCGWKNLREEIEEMLEDERFEFARETLEGVYDWVNEHRHVTDRQRRSVQRIWEAVHP